MVGVRQSRLVTKQKNTRRFLDTGQDAEGCVTKREREKEREQFILYCSWRAISKLINQKLVAFRLLADPSSS